MHERYLRLPSRHMGRSVHLWTFGWWGTPVLVFPSASGLSHEWRAAGAVQALAPLIAAGRIKLYCPESNPSEGFNGEGHGRDRMSRVAAYERFILDELVPWIRADCQSPHIRLHAVGVSLGALYAANAALKHPETFQHALCLSGRYDAQAMFDGYFDEDLYFNAPLAYVPNLHGRDLDRVRRHTALTLVIGLGPFEGACVSETARMATTLRARGVPHHLDVWGHDSAHHWDWWKKQLLLHMSR